MRKFATALFVGALVVGVAACGGGGSDKIGVSKNGKKITIGDGKNGNITIGGGSLPDGFPKSDVPLPSNSTSDIVSSGSVTASGNDTWTIAYKATKDGAKAYKSKLEDAGFKADSSYSSGSGSSGSSSYYSLSDGKYDVNVIGATDTKGQATLVITVTKAKASSTTSTTHSSSSGDSGSSGGSRMSSTGP